MLWNAFPKRCQMIEGRRSLSVPRSQLIQVNSPHIDVYFAARPCRARTSNPKCFERDGHSDGPLYLAPTWFALLMLLFLFSALAWHQIEGRNSMVQKRLIDGLQSGPYKIAFSVNVAHGPLVHREAEFVVAYTCEHTSLHHRKHVTEQLSNGIVINETWPPMLSVLQNRTTYIPSMAIATAMDKPPYLKSPPSSIPVAICVYARLSSGAWASASYGLRHGRMDFGMGVWASAWAYGLRHGRMDFGMSADAFEVLPIDCCLLWDRRQ